MIFDTLTKKIPKNAYNFYKMGFYLHYNNKKSMFSNLIFTKKQRVLVSFTLVLALMGSERLLMINQNMLGISFKNYKVIRQTLLFLIFFW